MAKSIFLRRILLLYTIIESSNVSGEQNLKLNPFMLSAYHFNGISEPDFKNLPQLAELHNEISSKWPSGIIEYYVDMGSYDFVIASHIRMTMNLLEATSCIKFKSVLLRPDDTAQSTWLHITNPARVRSCDHNPQVKGKEIVLILGLDCVSKTDILHALLHAVGFKDEVQHPHRDQFIRVLWNNIHPGYRSLYSIPYGVTPGLVVEYDPLSVMHFADHDYSINGRATLEPLISGLVINPTHGLSQLDKLKLRLYFGHICQKRDAKKVLNACANSLKSDKFKDISETDEDKKSNEKENRESRENNEDKEDFESGGNNEDIEESSEDGKRFEVDIEKKEGGGDFTEEGNRESNNDIDVEDEKNKESDGSNNKSDTEEGNDKYRDLEEEKKSDEDIEQKEAKGNNDY